MDNKLFYTAIKNTIDYYRRYLDISPSLDFEGKEKNWEERLVAEILFDNLLRQLDDKTPAYKYKVSDDIGIARYEELLKERDLL